MRPLVLRCREMLVEGRRKARVGHDCGTPGRQIATVLSNLYDDIVTEVYEDATSSFVGSRELSKISLLAHGGFGRCDVSPYSDADMMLLTDRGGESIAAEIAKTLIRDLGDIGIDPGLAIRRGKEACQLSWSDPRVYTSLTEVRLLSGSVSNYQAFYEKFRRGAMRRRNRVIAQVVEARQTERRKWGETAYMLRPNVKRSRGGLRDIQSIRWIGFAKYGESDLPRLVGLGLLPAEDFRLVQIAYDFFLSLRHDLHFRTGKSVDVLDRHLQLDLAASWGYRDKDGVLAVEQFMQEYFENARNVRYAAAYCVEELSHRGMAGRLSEFVQSMRLDDDIRMGPTRIWVAPGRLNNFVGSLPRVMDLMAFANLHDRRIDHQTWRAIRMAIKDRSLQRGHRQPELGNSGIESFKLLMGRPTRLATLLRRMHDLRVIEWLIPPFARIRGMLQFNAYHKYTVDAHSIRAVEAATALAEDAEEPDEYEGFRRLYRRIEPKWLFHLTLLIHDIGKGFEEDHCVVGERMAIDIAERLNLSADDTELMSWLVRHHLLVNDCAFRHDLSDPQIVLDFAKEVGSIRRLEWLVVHTVADLIAVGPDVATDWKLRLIEDLYTRTRRYFDSQNLPGSPSDPEIDRRREQLGNRLTMVLKDASISAETLTEMVDSIPLSLLTRHESEILVEAMVAAFDLSDEKMLWCRGRRDDTVGGIHFIILRREVATAVGTFSRAAGALSALGLTIRRAQIERFAHFAWNDFWVSDLLAPDDSIHPERVEDLTERVMSLLKNDDAAMPKPPKRWSTSAREGIEVMPSKVTFDNETIDRFTILSLFTYDSPSLLYRVTTVLADQGLVLLFAKIDTHFDQIADVFYLTTLDGERLTDPDRQSDVRRAILDVVEDLADE